MVVLRSREVLPTIPPEKSAATSQPATPVQTGEPTTHRTPLSPTPNAKPQPSGDDSDTPTCRRSLRLTSKLVPSGGLGLEPTRKRKVVKGMEEKGEAAVVDNVFDSLGERDSSTGLSGALILRSGKSVVKRRVECGSVEEVINSGVELDAMEDLLGKGNEEFDSNKDLEMTIFGVSTRVRRYSREDKGKGVEKGDSDRITREVSEGKKRFSREEKGKSIEEEDVLVTQEIPEGSRVYSTEEKEKGKGKLVGDDSTSNTNDSKNVKLYKSRMEQFRDIARQNASRFAHFDHEEPNNSHLSSQDDDDDEMLSNEEEQKVEDWPGPFSTAMKIIRDRANKAGLKQGSSFSQETTSVPIMWTPKNIRECKPSKESAPSLQELCLAILAKNADAITSLENVPDALRHQLCKLLCDSRKMDGHFLDLLVCGFPTEIRIRDCSWLTEEEFTKCFSECDARNLMVLQLDQSGRCMTDYTLHATLVRASVSLPVLSTLSLCGACRISDSGLQSLVSRAPALRSINLSQCSLLTSASIGTLADSLGSVLKELYLDDCQRIDAPTILLALKKLEHLEVLSLARIQSVSDKFVREFIATRGHNMKELVLTDCVNLTDSSLKVISATCSGLVALDLSNLRKLTDSSLGYLANGCPQLQRLKLCRNAFSDEAIAAYLESSGELLIELALNSIWKVGNNTALSLTRRARNLLNLDLSWCRNLTDAALGLIVDSCLSLRELKLFGCGQITNAFLDGHSNPKVKIIGLKMSPVLEHLRIPYSQGSPLCYRPMPSSV
ncbi:hypothetical protein K2173_015988 [Erythroxylum novogranatense]|uniref:Rad7 n=1 Tax=Erythroxylum novogranatense TaxID=1862640 RepID=A0AAV8SF05_9ROSI|nr:hypothetical protein K2173_015988 [Erythroxylum novogranatense]